MHVLKEQCYDQLAKNSWLADLWKPFVNKFLILVNSENPKHLPSKNHIENP